MHDQPAAESSGAGAAPTVPPMSGAVVLQARATSARCQHAHTRSSNRRVRPTRVWAGRLLAVTVAAALIVVTACGGNKKDGATARVPTDPRRVPTATVPADLPTPIAALAGTSGVQATVPDTYVVKSGDTLATIARDLSITTEALTSANPNLDPRALRIGQELRIPRPSAAPAPVNVARGPATPVGTPRGSATPGPVSSPAVSPGRSPTPGVSPTPGRSPTARPAATPSGSASTYTVGSGDTGCAIARKLGVSLSALAQANGLSVEGLANLRIGQVLQVPRPSGEGPGC